MTNPSKPPSVPTVHATTLPAAGGAAGRGAQRDDADDGGSERTADRDQLLVCGPTAEQDGYHVLRKRNQHIEWGKLQPLREGRPISGEVIRLSQPGTGQAAHGPLFDVDVLLPPPAHSTTHKGPARVTSMPYRSGWDAIFGDEGAPLSPQRPDAEDHSKLN